MSDIAIRIEGLGKRYRIGKKQAAYRTLREAITETAVKPVRRARQLLRHRPVEAVSPDESFWALKDVSFEVKHGEVIGVIGRNGAGKSTLLKILSQITDPTEGVAAIYGRVGALLEVGTGFHTELTGRENVYLNGAILGMRQAEITRKFDEIVAFAEVEKFIDMPVKHYSSGMHLRLAFAVAAHLEPEIIIVDEVLAVGDASFQKKCLGKMGSIATEGRTVFFVSHNMAVIRELCTRVLLIRTGHLDQDDGPEKVIGQYLADGRSSENGEFDFSTYPRLERYRSIIRHLALRSLRGVPTAFFYPEDGLQIEVTLATTHTIKNPRIAVAIEDSLGRRITTLASYFQREQLDEISGHCKMRCILPKLNLGSGRYLISISIGTMYSGLLDNLQNAAWFEVGWLNSYGNGEPYHPIYGPVLTNSIWERIE